MKKFLVLTVALIFVVCILALGVSAQERQEVVFTDASGVTQRVPVVRFENDTPEAVASVLGNNATQQSYFKDDGAYAVLKAKDGTLCAYPTWYIIEPSGNSASYVAISEVEYTYINKMEKEINGENAKSYDLGAVLYIEFPEGMTHLRNNGFFGRTSCYEKNVVEMLIPSTVTTVQDAAFSQNKSIKRVRFAENNQLTLIGDDSFLDCSALEYFEFEKLDKVTKIDGFNNCALLTGTLDLSGSALTEIGNNAFNSCKFSNVVLPDTVKRLGTGVFKNNGLTAFKFPKDLEYIGDDAFIGNPNMVLESGILPSGLTYVGINFLGGCQMLPETIVFPEGVTTIPDEGFPNVSRPNGQGVLNIVFLGKMTKVIIDGSPYQNWAEQVNVYFAQNTISDFNGNVYSYTDKESGTLGTSVSQSGTLILDVSDRSVSSTSKVGDNFITLIFCGENGKVQKSHVLTVNGNSITEDRGTFDMASHSHMAYSKVAGDCTSDRICIVCDVNFANKAHDFATVMLYENGFMANGVKSEACQSPECMVVNDGIVLDPIFVSAGFSMTEKPDANGNYSVVQGYVINRQAYAEYVSAGNALSYGFVVSVKRVTGDTPLTVTDGAVTPIEAEKVVFVTQDMLLQDYVDLKVTGFNRIHNGEEIIMCLYVFDGADINYISNGVQSSVAGVYEINLPQ